MHIRLKDYGRNQKKRKENIDKLVKSNSDGARRKCPWGAK